jgi:glycosidase
MRHWFLVFLAGCLSCTAVASHAQQSSPSTEGKAPRIEKIDPPGWWAGLPSPMLLLHGEGLNDAHFNIGGKAVVLKRTQSSENGHWAFLWLETQNAAPQKLAITAENDFGKARVSYELAARSTRENAHSGFTSADVLYLIMTDRFAHGSSVSNPPGDDRIAPRGWHGGNLAGIEEHLDYLKQLGVTAVWTTPVASNDAMQDSYHGYAATDLYAVDPHFGTLAEYRHLSDALHARSMKLVIDLVPNHIGVRHLWVSDPPAPEWLHGTLQHHISAEHDFYQLVNPHTPMRAWRGITTGWFTDAMPDLNQENPLVSQYLIDNALWWVETANVDGIRLDTFPYVNRAFWHDLHATLHKVYPNLTTVGEIYNRDPEVTSFFAGGVTHSGIDTGLDTPFDFPVNFTLRDVLARDKPMTELANVLRQDALYPHPERLVTFIGNHDTTRFLTEAGGSVPRLKLALGLMLTLRGMPQIYSGDEIGMPGGNDPDNRHDFPGGFPGDSRNAFARDARTPSEESVFAWTSALIAFRAAHSELKQGIEQNVFADADVFAFVRAENGEGCKTGHSGGRLLIVVNKARENRSVELPVEDSALAGCTQIETAAATSAPKPRLSNGNLRIEEPAESITVYTVR